MTTILRTIAVLPIASLIAGCESEPLSSGDFESQVIALGCEHVARCGTIGGSEQAECQREATAAKRAQDAARAATYYDLAEALAAGRLAFDPSAASTCLEAYRTLQCSGPDALEGLARACQHVYRGLVAPGGACKAELECAGGFCFNAGSGGARCVGYAPRGAACGQGASCDWTVDRCSANVCAPLGGAGTPCDAATKGFQCQGFLTCSSGGVCGPGGQSGDTCGINVECATGLACEPNASADACGPLQASGQTCSFYLPCSDGLICAGLDRTMITSTGGCGPVLDIGSGCDPAASACPRDATCDASAHVCVHYMRVGGPCSATGPACSTGASFGLAYCDGQSYSSGNCQILIPLLYCDSGTNTCALSLAVGDPCTPPPLGYEDPCLGRCDATTLKCVAQ